MSNKSFYTLGSLACLVSLFLRMRADRMSDAAAAGSLGWVMHLAQLLICGIALHYVFQSLMGRPRVTLLALLMLGVGAVYNPLYPVQLPLTTWLVVEIISMGLFFVCAMRERLPGRGEIRREEERRDEPDESDV